MIVTIAGQKGGAGKTTVALSIASEWTAKKKKVLLVDADPQGSTKTWGEVASEQQLATPTIVSMGAGLHRPDQLPKLAAAFEHTIIDCPPRHGDIQRAALMVADLALLPCGPSALDVWALTESLALIQAAREIRPQLAAAILITRKIPRTSLGASIREALASTELPILKTELCLRITYPEATAAGKGVTQYDPRSIAATEVKSLVKELEAFLKTKKKEEEHAQA